jgi:hypothetical protein
MKLGNKHIFKAVRIIKKAGIRDLVVSLMKTQGMKDAESMGISIFDIIMEAFSSEEIETLIYEFLADVSQKSAGDISGMGIEETIELFKAVAAENNLKSFFGSVSAILKKS